MGVVGCYSMGMQISHLEAQIETLEAKLDYFKAAPNARAYAAKIERIEDQIWSLQQDINAIEDRLALEL